MKVVVVAVVADVAVVSLWQTGCSYTLGWSTSYQIRAKQQQTDGMVHYSGMLAGRCLKIGK